MRRRLALLIAALWWGSLTTIGFGVVPVVFSFLGNPGLAGGVAVRLFTLQSYAGAVCGLALLILFRKNSAEFSEKSDWVAIFFMVLGILLALLLEFGVTPRIVQARLAGGQLGLWHSVGTTLYMGQRLCAGTILWTLSAHRD